MRVLFLLVLMISVLCIGLVHSSFCDQFCGELDDLCIDEEDDELIFKCDVDGCLTKCNSYSEEKRRRLATCYEHERYKCGTWTWGFIKKNRYCYRKVAVDC